MSTVIDLAGYRFGRLTILGRLPNDKHGRTTWSCRCECGGWKVAVGERLRNGSVKSCGCLQKETRVRNVVTAAASPENRERMSRLGKQWGGAGRVYPDGTRKFSLKFEPELIERARKFGPLTRVMETALRLYIAQREGDDVLLQGGT